MMKSNSSFILALSSGLSTGSGLNVASSAISVRLVRGVLRRWSQAAKLVFSAVLSDFADRIKANLNFKYLSFQRARHALKATSNFILRKTAFYALEVVDLRPTYILLFF